MDYIYIILLNILSCIIIILNGLSFKKIISLNGKFDVFETGLYGIISISFITFILNFFFRISNLASLIILFLPLILIWKEAIDKRGSIFFWSSLLGLISSLIMFFDNVNRPDAGLYHLPFVNIINDSKIIIGVANLEFRFGHISILQYLAAAFNNFIFTEKGVLLSIANIFSFVIFYLISLARKGGKIYWIIIFLFLFNILYSMNRYSGFGNDDPGHMFYYLVVANFILVFLKKENIKAKNNVVLFSTFTFLIKPFLIFVFLFPLLLIFSKKIKLFFSLNWLSFVFIFLWIIKNILISSCALYPEGKSCIKTLKWSTYKSEMSNPERAKLVSEAWSKDWPNKTGSIKYEEYIKNFNWLNIWANNHLKIVLKEIAPQILILFLLFVFRPVNPKNEIFEKKWYLSTQIFIVGFISFTVWFLKYPTYRYGHAYIITFLNSFLILYLFSDLKIFSTSFKNIRIIGTSIMIILMIGLLLKNFIRIKNQYEFKYVDYPWPKMYSFTKENLKNSNKAIVTRDNKILYYIPFPYELCMYSKSPCTKQSNIGDISVTTVLGYKIYFYN